MTPKQKRINEAALLVAANHFLSGVPPDMTGTSIVKTLEEFASAAYDDEKKPEPLPKGLVLWLGFTEADEYRSALATAENIRLLAGDIIKFSKDHK